MREPVRTEKQVQQDIVTALATLGCYVADLTQPRATMLPIGLPDLYWRHAGWRLHGWMEVKRKGGQVSPGQAAWHEDERRCGGNIAVVSSVAEALQALRQAGAPLPEMRGVA